MLAFASEMLAICAGKWNAWFADEVAPDLLHIKRLHAPADTWPQALAIQARPASMPAAARALAALADDIWHAAGDTSADYNWCGPPWRAGSRTLLL